MNTVNKVVEITIFFWVMKIFATILGETAGDLLSMTMNLGYSVSSIILLGFFLVTLVFQLSSRKFHPVLYWTVILSTTTAGTAISDFMDRTLGLGYAMGSLILLSGLLIVLAVWHYNEKTLAVNHIYKTKVELFYWVAILFSNTLGTALGDFLGDDLGLQFVGGALLTGSIIGVIAFAHYRTRINQVLLFWIAFVLTRPFGATFGDWLTKPIGEMGLGFGTVSSSIVLASLFAMLVIYTWKGRMPVSYSPVPHDPTCDEPKISG